MTDLTSFFKTDLVDDHVANDVNVLIAAALRAEYTNTETITATKELSDNDCQFQVITASGAARTVELAPEASGNHITIIYNTGTNNVVVKDDSGAVTLKTLAADEWAMFVPVLGETWKVLLTPDISGWIEVTDAWSYASANTITVPSNATLKYQKGDPIRWVQGGVTKFANIISLTATVLTVLGDAVANSAITSPAFSKVSNPYGFPDSFAYTPTLSGTGFTLSNGTVAGRVSFTGRRVRWTCGYTFGSSDTMGTASLAFTNPVTITSPEDAYGGTGLILDSGTARFALFVEVNASNITCYLLDAASAHGIRKAFSSTNPMTWATGDKLSCQGEGWLA